MSFYEPFDIEHVSNKYRIDEEYRYLIERLGKANTKRRQLLKYHNDHREKIVGRRVIANDGLDSGAARVEDTELGEDYYYSEAPTDMRTTVSTVYEGDFVDVEPVNLDSRSEAGFSMTSYATTAIGNGDLRVPPRSPGFENGPFQCQFCFVIVETENHV